MECLVGDVGAADYVVDLGGVLRDGRLGGDGPANVHRLDRVYQVLRRRDRDRDLRFYAVADAGLFSRVLFSGDLDGLRTIREWRERGLVETVDDADGRVLELGGLTGLRVLSGGERPDRQRGPASEPVVEVAPGPGGGLQVQGIGQVRPARFDVSGRLWHCPDPRCDKYDGRGPVTLLPRVHSGAATCDAHRMPLVDIGPRSLVALIKVMVDDECVTRFPLRGGLVVPVGRAPGPGGVNLAQLLGSDTISRELSRAHVVLRLDHERILVRDVSTNGVGIRRPAGLGEPELLRRDSEYAVRRGEVVVLTGRVGLVRGGQAFPGELAAQWKFHAVPGA